MRSSKWWYQVHCVQQDNWFCPEKILSNRSPRPLCRPRFSNAEPGMWDLWTLPIFFPIILCCSTKLPGSLRVCSRIFLQTKFMLFSSRIWPLFIHSVTHSYIHSFNQSIIYSYKSIFYRLFCTLCREKRLVAHFELAQRERYSFLQSLPVWTKMITCAGKSNFRIYHKNTLV